MSAQTAAQVSEQARFAAREFVARFAREMGCEIGEAVADRMAFAFEIGYMRGRTDGAASALELFEELRKVGS